MEPYSLQTQWHAKAYDKTGAGEAGVPEGGEKSGRTATERLLGSVAECTRTDGSEQDTEAAFAL